MSGKWITLPVGVLRQVDGEIQNEDRKKVRDKDHLPNGPLHDPEEMEGISGCRLPLHHDCPALGPECTTAAVAESDVAVSTLFMP